MNSLRIFALGGALLLAGALRPALQPALAADLPTLRGNVVVSGDYVHLGDLFDNVDDKASMVVARAPAPGRSVMENSAWLRQVAANAGLQWTPDNPFIQTTIERSGVAVSDNLISQALKQSLLDQGMPKSSDIDILSGLNGPIMVAQGNQVTVGVQGLSYDRMAGRFSASVLIPANSSDATRLTVSGRVYDMVDVPVLARSVDRGDLLSAHDFTTQHMRRDQLRPDAVTDINAMIGMAARQSLRMGEPVWNQDLQRQIMVPRNSLVTLVLHTSLMTITAQGRSLDQGSLGDVVRVVNTRSNLTIQGRVDGPDQVSVLPAGSVALAN